MASPQDTDKTIRNCPRCGKEMVFTDNPFRPFCSERCKLVDLGNWISGTYSVPVMESEEGENEQSMKKEGPEKE
jgi:endogenous inhibitor of DNA gyrase (YacG/DUF329 family)